MAPIFRRYATEAGVDRNTPNGVALQSPQPEPYVTSLWNPPPEIRRPATTRDA